MAATDGTGSGLIEFLDWAGSRGEINPTTARAIASASRKVLAIEDDPENTLIEKLDVDSILSRFETLHRTEYSESSMNTYLSRFRTAVSMYSAWLNKRSDWKSMGPSARKVSKGAKDSVKAAPAAQQAENTRPSPPGDIVGQAMLPTERMVPYDLPLRPDLRARLILPEDLTVADANRIAAFVKSLAFSDGNDAAGAHGSRGPDA